MVEDKFNKKYGQVADGRGTKSLLLHVAPQTLVKTVAHEEDVSDLRQSHILASTDRLQPIS